VETHPGQGTFVVEKINPFVTTLTGEPETGRGGGEGGTYITEVAASDRLPEMSEPRVEIQKADRSVARSLRIDEGASVVSRHQQRFIDGTPWSLQTSFYPMTLVQRGAARLLEATDIDGGTVAYLAENCGIEQAGYRDTIAVRAPDENESRFFKLPADGRVPVFEIYRVGFDKEGNRFRLTVTVYPSDRNRLRVDVGDVPRRGQPASAGGSQDDARGRGKAGTTADGLALPMR
jgi:GntR family transcriptional regulator